MSEPTRIIGVLIDPRFTYGRNVWYGSGHYVQQMSRPWQFRGVRYGTPDSDAVAYLKACGVDGVIAHVTAASMVKPLQRLNVPVVSTAGGVRDLPFPRVSTDDIEVGHMAAEYFVNQGFRRYAYIGTPEEYAVHRGVGFRTTLVKAGFDCQTFEPVRVTSETLKEHDSADEITAPTREWLRSLRKPTALLACDDDIASQVVEIANSEGLRIPEDLAIMGVDDDELLCQFATPPLSSIKTPSLAVGFEAARILSQLMRGEAAPEQPMRVPPIGVAARQSTDLLVVSDPEVARALRYIREHASERINVADVVEYVDICRSLLERRFKAMLGRTPFQEIQRVRIDNAKQILAETNLSMPKVAGATGFRDEKHLHAIFRKWVDMPPRDYRAQFQLI